MSFRRTVEMWCRGQLLQLTLLLVLICTATPAFAETIIDDFGQEVEKALHDRVSLARELRMENFGAAYDLDRSIELLEEITAAEPDYYRAWFNLALAHFKKDPENREAYLSAFKEADRIQTANEHIVDGSLYNTIGWILLNDRQYEESEEYLRKGLALQESNSEWTNAALLYNMGRLHFERLQYDQAEAFLDRAIDDYKNPQAIELKAILEKSRE